MIYIFGTVRAVAFVKESRLKKDLLTARAWGDYLYKSTALGGRLTVGLQTLDLRIGVRIPASQPIFMRIQ